MQNLTQYPKVAKLILIVSHNSFQTIGFRDIVRKTTTIPHYVITNVDKISEL